MRLPRINAAARISFRYLLFGVLWIVFSDRIILFFSKDPQLLTNLQTYKGWVYVVASAMLVYYLLNEHILLQRGLNEKLEKNEERLRLALYAAQQGIYDLNLLSGEAVVNDIYAQMLGYDPQAFAETNERWLDRMHPDDRGPVGQVFKDYISGKLPEYRVEFRQRTAGGDWIWLLSIGKIIEYDGQGRPLRMLGTHTNITGSKKSALEITRLLAENGRLIENLQQANHELVQAYDATIEGWSRAMDLRDHETEGHTRRVTKLAVALAQRVGFAENEIIHIRRGALLHDIGKMGIPDAILLKEDLLNPDEFEIMRLHPKYAYEMLEHISYLKPALDIPHHHHERWDGSGYPDGLSGMEIPAAARLFAIIDVYDALTIDRPYRKAWTEQAALEYIQSKSGQHFDPDMVKVFFEYIESGE